MITMKEFTFAVLVSGLLMFSNAAYCQGFGNLNFEFANVPFVPSGQFGADVPISQVMPAWSAFGNGTNALTTIQHNNLALSGPEVGILGPAWNDPALQILEGSYSALRLSSRTVPSTSVAIAETGRVPSNARSLTFFSSPSSIFQVTFGGQVIPLAQVGSGPNYIVQGADISQFADQTGELRFTAGPGGGGILDNIHFSSSPIPEPTTRALYGFGALLLSLRVLRLKA